jgi:plasmid maintenance system antidote protein VapI
MHDPEVERVLTELREWCAAKYGRQAEVARTLGVTRQQVYDWIARRTQPSVSMWLRLKSFLKTQRKGKE